jgi:transcriptional/translational regulatory protein YebC/TACO1
MHERLHEPICHEGYGPGATAVIVTCEPGRVVAAAPVRSAFREHGGRRGASGSVSYLFRPVGVLRVTSDAALPERAAKLGVEEIVSDEPGIADLLVDPVERERIEREMRRMGYACLARGAGWHAMQRFTLPLPERRRLDDLVQQLAALEGVAHVYTNAQTTDELLAPV